MAWSDLIANQWVRFIDAQTSGFALKPGQSHSSSTDWMVKDTILAMYEVSSSPMSSHAGNQAVAKQYWQASGDPAISCGTGWTTSAGDFVSTYDVNVGEVSGSVEITYNSYYANELKIEVQYEGGGWTTVLNVVNNPSLFLITGSVFYNFVYNTSDVIKVRFTKVTY